MGSLPSREKPFSIPMAAAVPTPSPMPTQAAPNSFLALALCDFPSGSDAPTVLRMGEQLNVLSEDGEWWLVASKVSGKECLIPSSCVAKVWHRWLYEGISREKAEELLLRPGNHSGSFLIRQSQTRKGCYSLSVRRTELTSWDSVTHYRIHRLENGWLYISPRLTFSNLHDLVDHYTGIKTAVMRRAKQKRSAHLQRIGSSSATGCKKAAEANPDAKAPALNYMQRRRVLAPLNPLCASWHMKADEISPSGRSGF
eukprot:XP_027328522.1 src-like-adapter 2 isoform X3 [Anas platyrhynchos]